MLGADVWPVSVNDHWVEAPDLFMHGIPAALRDAAPRLIELEDGSQAWRVGSRNLPLARMLPSELTRRDTDATVRRFDDIAPSAWQVEARIAAMDADCVAVHTLMPHVMGFAGERLASLEPAAWSASARAYNDYLLSRVCAAAPDRLAGVALLPLAELEAAPTEIERAAVLGARAVSLPDNPVQLRLPSFHDPVWQPVFDAADAADLAIFIHLGSSGGEWAPAGDPHWRPIPTHVTAANFEMLETASDLVFSPLLAERPSRRIVLLEGNIGWAPYLEERVDFAVANRRAGQGLPGRRPGEILHDQILGSFLNDPIAIAERHTIGIHRLLWQSDFPHIDSLWPGSRANLAEQLADVPEEEARQIAELNARALLRMPAKQGIAA